jgi:ATP-dependent RNA helicase DHX29
MAKKKKPAANPARGFATISVASKPKQETPIEPKLEVTTPKQDGGALPFSSLETERAERPASHSTHQTPEELEAQLERDELQLLVEKHAAKVRRESRRQVSRFQTERRVLRAQSQSMTTYDWLSENVLDHIVSLAQAESNDSNRKQGQQSLLKVLSEEDALVKLWILELTLRELAFSDDHIVSVLKWLCANAINVDMTAAIWGFQEGLEWLALDQCEGHSFSYDEVKNKPSAVQAPDSSPPGKKDLSAFRFATVPTRHSIHPDLIYGKSQPIQ